MSKKKLWFGLAGTAAAAIYAGLRIPLRAAPLFDGTNLTGYIPLPDDLPAPVHRYLTLSCGDKVPLATAPRVTGTARMVVPGLPVRLWMNARWHASYDPGKSFTRVMTLGFFGQPVLTAVDEYRDGTGTLTVMGKRDSGPQIDQAADMVLWAESVWMPSVLLTTPGLRWTVVDETRARLYVPYQHGEHEFTWHFDRATGLLSQITAFRFKTANARWRTPWRVDMLEYGDLGRMRVPTAIAITWEDDGTPWAVFRLADMTLGTAEQPIRDDAISHASRSPA